jgi:taurine--2-oxoglutarate transaminase
MAAIVATLDAMQEEGVVENARRIGEDVLGPGLKALADKHPVIGEARGIGLFWALELVEDRQHRTPLAPARMARIKAALLERGLLPFIMENRIHVLPPCIVSAEEVRQALAIYDEVLGSLD